MKSIHQELLNDDEGDAGNDDKNQNNNGDDAGKKKKTITTTKVSAKTKNLNIWKKSLIKFIDRLL